jgi:phosphoglycerate dehydrogenase-like enzyme
MSNMPKPLVLVAPHPRTIGEIFDPTDLSRLHAFAEVGWGRDEPLDANDLDECLDQAWAVVGYEPPLGSERLEQASSLQAIVEVGGHFPQTIDYAECFRRSIHVLSCAPAFAAQVAELALAMTFGACRSMIAAHMEFTRGVEVWQGDRPTDFTLFGQTVGFIGFGGIARKLLTLLAPFGCRVLVYDPWLPDASIESAGCIPVRLDQLLSSSCVVYVLAPPTPENHSLLGGRELSLMPSGALLVLISRAHLVDFDALVAALQEGRIQAAIDVFPSEPMPLDAAIRRIPNVVLSAHRGASIRRERRAIGRMLVDDLQLIATGRPPTSLQRAQPDLIRRRFGDRGGPAAGTVAAAAVVGAGAIKPIPRR